MRWTTCRGKPLSSPKGWGCEIIPTHKAIQSPCLYSGNSAVPSEGRATPPLLTQGTTTPGTGRTEAPPPAASQMGKKTQCRSFFLRTKGLCALLLELPPLLPGPPPNLQEGGQRAIFQRPPVYLGNKPTPPLREGSFGGRPKSQPPLPQETAAPAPRPGPPRRPRTRPGKGRGGEQGAAAPVPRSPPTSRSRARRALPGLRLPSPREGRAQTPGSTVERRPRPPEPQAAGEAGTLGLSGGQRLPPEPARTPGAYCGLRILGVAV